MRTFAISFKLYLQHKKMFIFQVESIPLKDIIASLAASFGVSYMQNCDEYSIELPSHIGSGQIFGINFDDGLGLLIYKVVFKQFTRLEFTLDHVHPIKYIYSLQGSLDHSFANEDIKHTINQYYCAIVASERNNGHVIEFEKDVNYEVVSIEIDRQSFLKDKFCEIKKCDPKLQNLFLDVEAQHQFYHEANSGVYFKDIMQDINRYQDNFLARKLNNQCVAIQIFINQLVQFDDDMLSNEERTVLRIEELKRVEETSTFIKKNFTADLSIKNLSKISALNPNKLQTGFKHLYNTTINEFVTNARLEKSNILLKNKEYNVAEVVALIGLESSSYFSKIYKKKYGITPKNYKKMFS